MAIRDSNLYRPAILISDNADSATPTYVPLGKSDIASANRKQLRLNLAKPLVPGKTYKIKISAGIIADRTGNKNIDIETPSFTVDLSGPKLK
jgi:hypothetical protein